ncbi:MAG: chemotaxis-specific protein-glutamate methyltransferase CheB [Phycisphaerae bacterium]|nr:chemotaxis-specific protein-glutamate methyltransferase CheB [Phycisphaerae bacterium]
MSDGKIKVLIVEDSAVMRQMLAHVLQADPQLQVIGAASDGAEALELLRQRTPDVITMDINMPRMDGFEVTRRIMETQPIPVVIVSASWKHDEVKTTFNAVEAGAVAVVGKPHGLGHPQHDEEARSLVQTVKAMSEVKLVRRWSRAPRSTPAATPAAPPPVPSSTNASEILLVAIGASTGGPLVLQTLLAGLPPRFPVPILIVQHIAVGFLEGMVDWLRQSTGRAVFIGTHGQIAEPGIVYLAPDRKHMGVASDRRIVLTPGDASDVLCPSVAHLFAATARAFGPAAAGVLLTGMGRDGAEELLTMRQQGALTIAQDEESSVVFGMPGEAVKLGAARYVLPPERIAALLATTITSR